jgi:hypothetical protein
MNVMISTQVLFNWSKDLIIVVVAYAHVAPLYLCGGTGYSGCARLLPDGTLEDLPVIPNISKYLVSPGNTTRCGDNIYVIGGFDRPAGIPSSVVYRFHTPTQIWTILPPLPKSSGFHMVFVVNDHIYIIGGFRDDNMISDTDPIEVFDIKKNEWTTTSGGQLNKTRFCGVAIVDTIYIFGGASRSSGSHSPSIESFNINTKTWATLASLKYDHDNGSAVGIGHGRILVMGGHHNHKIIDIIEEYDVVSNTCKIVTWKLPYPMIAFAAWFDSSTKTLHVAFGEIIKLSANRLSNMYFTRQLDNDHTRWTLVSTCSSLPARFGYCM